MTIRDIANRMFSGSKEVLTDRENMHLLDAEADETTAKKFADAVLDFFERKAAKTKTPLDDLVLLVIRKVLNVPEFDD